MGMRLLGDVGGTHVRLACQAGRDAPIGSLQVLACADFPSLAHAIGHYLTTTGVPIPQEAAIAIAAPMLGDEVRMTNHAWRFSRRELQASLGLGRLEVINDFTALALSLPALDARQRRQLGGGAPDASAPLALLGPGTGLGVSGLLRARGDLPPLAIAGEGGHVTLAAESELEWRVLQHFARKYGHVSAERVLSGPGLVDLWRAVEACDPARVASNSPAGAVVTSPADVTRLALEGHHPLGLAALELFCGFLGAVAGNLALTLGARGGVYLGGGIVGRLGAWFDGSPFRHRFESKGRYRDYLAAIPCFVISDAEAPALLGASRVLDQP